MRKLVYAAVVSVAVSPALAYDCSKNTHKAAYSRIDTAFRTGILARDPRGGATSVLVADDYWNRMTYPQKIQFAEDLVCAVAGVDKALVGMTFKSLMTGKTLGEWSPGKLKIP